MRATLRIVALAAVCCLLAGSSLADPGDCGQPQSTGATPKTSDALAALKAAVGSPSTCDAEPCVCDVNASGGINTSDALRILRVAVGQEVTLECDCGCTLLQGPSALVSLGAALDAPAQQILIEAKIVEVTQATANELGFDASALAAAASVTPGGTSGYDTNLAVSSNATGGPANLQYFLYSAHRPEGALPVLNQNFVSPFSGVKSFFTLPTTGCITLPDGSTSVPQNHPGGDPVENLAPDDGGYGDLESIANSLLTSGQVATLLTSLQSKNGTEVLTAPALRLWPGQSAFHMVDDIQPGVNDFESGFKMRIQDVTMSPFGNFTGPVFDFAPTIDGSNVNIRLRVGTELATFFFSTAFQVDGSPTDAEIPLHRRSTTSATFQVAPGQTLLVGGLKRMGNPTVEKGLSVIGDVPLVGSLFTHKKLDPANRLLLLLTPTIVDAE